MPEVRAQGAQLLELLRALARELHPRDPAIGRLGLDDSLERDFGLDSLARVELAARIEQALGVRLSEEGFSEAETARDLLRHFEAGPRPVEGRAAPVAVPREPPAAEHPAFAVETLTEALDWHLARHPERVHITLYGERDGAEEIGFGALAREAGAFAAGLAARGIAPGERVAIMLPTGRGFFVAFYGALRAGAIVVPCNPLYTVPELRHQLEDSGAETIVVLSRMYPVVKAAREGSAVKHVIVTNIKEEMPPVLRLLFTVARERKDGHRQPFAGDAGAVAFREVRNAPAERFDAGTKKDDVALLQYTGGTTGVSKAAMLSHRALVANTLQCRAWFVNTKDATAVTMAVMPFFHVYGLTVVMSLAVQAAAAMLLEPQFELEHVLKDVARHRPTTFSGAPRIYNAIINSPLAQTYDLRSIDACISGSAPLLIETHRRFVELTGANLVEGYGLTEAAPVTHCNPVMGERRNGTIGLPFPGTEARVVDPASGVPLPAASSRARSRPSLRSWARPGQLVANWWTSNFKPPCGSNRPNCRNLNRRPPSFCRFMTFVPLRSWMKR